MRRELTTEYQLFAENRAFALRDNFDILEDELKRLALLAAGQPDRRQSAARAAAAVGRAPELGPLQHRGAAAVGRRHAACARCPIAPAYRGQSFGDRALVQGRARPSDAGADLPRHRRARHRAAPSRSSSRSCATGAFAGALVGDDRARRGEPHHAGAARQPAAQDRRDADRRRSGADHLSARPGRGAGRARTGARDRRRPPAAAAAR